MRDQGKKGQEVCKDSVGGQRGSRGGMEGKQEARGTIWLCIRTNKVKTNNRDKKPRKQASENWCKQSFLQEKNNLTKGAKNNLKS